MLGIGIVYWHNVPGMFEITNQWVQVIGDTFGIRCHLKVILLSNLVMLFS